MKLCIVWSPRILCAYQCEDQSLQHQTTQVCSILSIFFSSTWQDLEIEKALTHWTVDTVMYIRSMLSTTVLLHIIWSLYQRLPHDSWLIWRSQAHRHIMVLVLEFLLYLTYLGRGAWEGASVVAMLASYISTSQSAYSTPQSCRSRLDQSPNLFHALYYGQVPMPLPKDHVWVFRYQIKKPEKLKDFYRTQVRSLSTHVTNSLTNWLREDIQKKNRLFLGNSPKQRTPPTHR